MTNPIENQTNLDIFFTIQHLESSDIVSVIKKRFEIEHISKYFKVSDYKFEGSTLHINESNCIMMEFYTLQREFPKYYASKSYKLLLLLDLRLEKEFKDDLKLEIQNISRKDNVDRIIVWSCEKISSSIIQALKNINADIIQIKSDEVEKIKSISHFIPPPQRDYNYAVSLNTIVDLLLKRLKKLFHLVLSEIAAPIYNTLYGKTKFATASIMKFEEELLQELVNDLKNRGKTGKVIDVGCGTGRHSFHLAKQFKEVYAFDFSPRMIEEAKLEKAREDVTNIFFSVADLEYEEIIDERAFYGKSDLVVASFGLASFIEDTSQMLRRFYNWMQDESYVVMSFYNSKSLILQVTPNWRDTSLSAHLDIENSTLKVELSPESIFHIFCKPYSDVVRGAINSIFEIEAIYSYPTLMAMMPNNLLENSLAKKLFEYLDSHISDHPEFLLGYYVIVVAKKGISALDASIQIKAYLDEMECTYEIINHPPVLSIDDARREIGFDKKGLVKTVIFQDRPTGKFITVSLMAEKKVPKDQLSEKLKLSKSRLVYAPEKEVIKLGFPLGGIAPFGFNKSLEVQSLIDEELLTFNSEWLYTGIGNNRKTLKIKSSDFQKLTGEYLTIKI